MGVLLTMALLLTLLLAPALAEEANASAAPDEEAVDTRLAVDAVPEEPDETPAAPVDTAEALAAAIAAAPVDGTETVVTLTGDIAGLDRMLNIEAGQNIVLDLDGHAVTVTAGFAGRPLRNYGTLTVTGSGTIDSSASKTGGYGAVDNFGVLTIENGTFAGSVDASGAAVKNRPGGEVTIHGGTFTGATTALYIAGESGQVTCHVYGGTFTSASKVAVYVGNNTPGDGGDRQEALVYIHDGTFRPGSGRETLYVDGLLGSLEVSGGTIAGYTALYECNPQGNPPEAVAQVSLSVAGGSFRSINGGVNAVYSEDCTGFITGGHYTSAPNAYLAPGKVAVPSNQSGYAAMVTDAGGSTPAQVGGSAGNQTTNAVSDGSQAEQELADRVAEEISGGDTLVNSHQLTAAAGTVAGENAITPETTVAGQTVTEALDAAIPDTTVTAADVRIVIVPYLSVSVTDVTVAQDGQKAFSLDISPMYITVATTADVQAGEDICLPQDPGQTNAVQIGDAMPLAVTEQVTVTIPLPAGFAGADEALYVHHRKGGVTYVYEGTVGAQGLTFENPHGFSPFTVTAVGAEAEVDGVRYASLQDALDTAADGGIVTVLASGLSARVSGDKRFSLMLADRVEAPALTAADGYELTQEGGIWTVCPVSQRPSGGASSGSAPRYAVALEQTEHGTVRVSPQQAAAGQTVTVTAVPDPGYAMDAVTVMRADGTEIPVQAVGGDGYIFSMPAGTVRVTVAFRLERAADPTAPDGWVNPYRDVAADAWYYGAAGYAAANGLMRGTTEHTFSPAGSMSRAMVWTVLARMDGQDVDGGQPWYQQAQDWAVAQGVSDGTAPAGAVTRGQLVAMLYRLAGSPAVTAQALEEMDSHPDSGGVGQWAQDAVAWALRLGILNGGSDGMLAPGRTITRAEAAAVLGRYHQMFS